MELFIDSADLREIEYWSGILPIDGVACNPSLVARAGIRTAEAVQKIFEIIGNDKRVHAQVVATDFADILNQARLVSSWHENVFVKIPVTLEGLKAIKILAQEGMKITATAVATAHQGFLAAKAGAAYLAPYVNRIDNVSANGVEVVRDLVRMIDSHGWETKVLGASFKNSRQVLEFFLAGGHGAAVSPELLKAIAQHPLTDASAEGFLEDYLSTFGTPEL